MKEQRDPGIRAMCAEPGPRAPGQPLHETVRAMIQQYLDTLDGDLPEDLYHLVLREVERPLLETVMAYCSGNQTRASACLGINRGTLRKKLRDHGLDQ